MYQLYVWYDVLQDYGSGICFAVATSIEDAYEKIMQSDNEQLVGEVMSKTPYVYDLNSKDAYGYLKGSA